MVIAQHYGVPTRLLDFTFSPLVAMHFALVDNKPGEDAVVWMIYINGLHRNNLPQKYTDILNEESAYVFTLDMLNQLHITIDQYNIDMNGKGLIFFEPPYIDERIRNQNSVFAILPNELDPLNDFIEKTTEVYCFIIPAEKVPLFRKQLDYFNITERTMFPGLEGTAEYLKRRYDYSKQTLQ